MEYKNHNQWNLEISIKILKSWRQFCFVADPQVTLYHETFYIVMIFTHIFIYLESKLNELPLILDMMPAEDLKLICKNFKVSYQSSKQKAVEALLKLSNSFKPIFGSKSANSVLLTKWVNMLPAHIMFVCKYAYVYLCVCKFGSF